MQSDDEPAHAEDEQLGDEELRMLRAVMKTTACDAARFGFSASVFHRCQVHAWRVARNEDEWIFRGSVPVELIVTRRSELLSREFGRVDAGAFDD